MIRALLFTLGLTGVALAANGPAVPSSSILTACRLPLAPSAGLAENCAALFAVSTPLGAPGSSLPFSLADDATNALVRDQNGQLRERNLYLNSLDLKVMRDHLMP